MYIVISPLYIYVYAWLKKCCAGCSCYSWLFAVSNPFLQILYNIYIYLVLFSCCLVALGGSCHDNLRFRWAGQKTKEPSVVAFLDSRMTQWF